MLTTLHDYASWQHSHSFLWSEGLKCCHSPGTVMVPVNIQRNVMQLSAIRLSCTTLGWIVLSLRRSTLEAGATCHSMRHPSSKQADGSRASQGNGGEL